MIVGAAHPMRDASQQLAGEVTQVNSHVRADQRFIPAQEQRIALAALQLLGALEGVDFR